MIHTNEAIADDFRTHYKYSLLSYLILTYLMAQAGTV